jgi:hypothetical protein
MMNIINKFINNPLKFDFPKGGWILFVLLGLGLNACEKIQDKEYRVGKDVVFYDGSIQETMVQKLAEFLKRDGYLDDSGLRVRLFSEADSFVFQLVADTTALSDTAYHELVREYTATLCREVFGGKNTAIWVCNKDFQPFMKFPCILVPEARREMSRVEVVGNLLYFSPQIDTADALALSAFLVRDSFFTGGERMITEFDQVDKGWVFRFVVNAETLENEASRSITDSYARRLSDSLFNGAAVSVHLCRRDMGVVYASPF